jgi:hypothetical protein
MGERSRLNWTRVGLVGSLAAGWLVGFGVHGSAAAASGWGDIPGEALLLGTALCAWAGVVAWVAAPAHRRPRIGALAGLLMVMTFVLGNVLIAMLWVLPERRGLWGGETWLSLLLESWFWVGVPVAGSLVLGALGWSAAALVGRPRHVGQTRA